MFTGIIEGLGTLRRIEASGQGKQMTFEADFALGETRIGDSIAVSGICLTVIMVQTKQFSADVSPETLARTTLGQAKIGARFNLERALRLSDRLGGHLVTGHIDGLGRIRRKQNIGNAMLVAIEVPETLSKYMIPKGSVAVDGISLTINDCQKTAFSVSIIPHTAKLTSMGIKREQEKVNIETDMLGKYVQRFLIQREDAANGPLEKRSGLDWDLLAKSGFI